MKYLILFIILTTTTCGAAEPKGLHYYWDGMNDHLYPMEPDEELSLEAYKSFRLLLSHLKENQLKNNFSNIRDITLYSMHDDVITRQEVIYLMWVARDDIFGPTICAEQDKIRTVVSTR
jgi:hypothetical protein